MTRYSECPDFIHHLLLLAISEILSHCFSPGALQLLTARFSLAVAILGLSWRYVRGCLLLALYFVKSVIVVLVDFQEVVRSHLAICYYSVIGAVRFGKFQV